MWDQSKFETLLVEWQVACDQSFDEVEKPEFRRLLEYVHRRAITIPSRATARRRLNDMGKNAVTETKEMFEVSLVYL